MKFFIVPILLLLYSIPVISQEPRFTWGNKINRKFGQLENLEIIGVDKDGFFSTYAVNTQITLEHYNLQNERFWTIALLPKTPEGHNATFHSVQMINGNLYMISSSTGDGETQVYAQEINHNGNYLPEIKILLQAEEGEKIIVATSPDDAAIAVLIDTDHSHTLTLLAQDLSKRWTYSISTKGTAEDLLVQPDGTTYLLVKSPAAAPSTTAYYLYKFNSQTGKSSELVLGHTLYRPIRARMVATPMGNVIIAGYVSPSNSVASHNPEPVGTFMYRVEKQNFQDRFAAYTPFSKKFLNNYKRFKPDYDNIQRLRNLHLDKIIPTADGGVFLLGEVCNTENRAGTFVYHNNDVLVVRLRRNGSEAFATSINKLQSGTNKQNTIRSYFAAVIEGALRILYLDFEYNYQAEDKIAMYSPRSTLKTPVMVTVNSDGTQKANPLHQTQTGRDNGFYLRPGSAFKVSNKEYIVIGMGPEFYRYGRMTF